ncbi:hypothetical protein KY290_008500 [Solanum tuberosum]|uniref:Retrotransposon Copia-like N-terminal domain-containing protein n=1 Tax=Solanum tuberosum TaxID=4113 RepID=A0ABQ7WAK9_SOLTU|nr:hypothetical protein KY290_008500 [Solanum tuberosum]
MYLIYEPSKSSCSTGQTAGKVVKVKKDAKDSGTIDDWKEKDVLLRSWISSTLTEESMHLIVGCSTAKEMWECLEKAYIQATKIINFARGLGLKYKTFVILGKAPYSTLNQFVYALTSFGIREDKEEVPQQNHNMVLSAQNGRGRGNNNINSSETSFKPTRHGTGSQNNQYRPGSPNNKSFQSENKEKNSIESCQICGRNNHTALKCFYWWNYSYQSADELSQATTRHHIHTEALTK